MATASALPQLMTIKWPQPHSLDFSLCLRIKTPLQIKCKHLSLQSRYYPLKKESPLCMKLLWKRLVRIHSRQEDRLSCRLLCTYQKGKEKNTLHSIIFWSLAKIHIHLLGAIFIFAPLCTSPVTFIIAFSPPNTHRLGGVSHSPQVRKLRLWSEGTCPGASSK